MDANASRLNEAMDKQNWEFYSKELRRNQGTKAIMEKRGFCREWYFGRSCW